MSNIGIEEQDPTLQKVISTFIERDKRAVDEFNFGGSQNIVEQLAFVSARLQDTMGVLVFLANYVGKRKP